MTCASSSVGSLSLFSMFATLTRGSCRRGRISTKMLWPLSAWCVNVQIQCHSTHQKHASGFSANLRPFLTLRPLAMPAVSRFVVLCTCRSYISVAMRSHIEEISPAFPGNLKLLFSQHRVQVLRRQAWMEVSGIYLVTRYLAWRC